MVLLIRLAGYMFTCFSTSHHRNQTNWALRVPLRRHSLQLSCFSMRAMGDRPVHRNTTPDGHSCVCVCAHLIALGVSVCMTSQCGPGSMVVCVAFVERGPPSTQFWVLLAEFLFRSLFFFSAGFVR